MDLRQTQLIENVPFLTRIALGVWMAVATLAGLLAWGGWGSLVVFCLCCLLIFRDLV
jgi:hypothetical protein